MLGNGRFWLWFWTAVSGVGATWAVLTVLFWLDSVRNLSLLSVAALLLAPAGGFQAALSMRKADPDDPL